MTAYRYHLRYLDGQSHRGVIEASTLSEAQRMLTVEQGILISVRTLSSIERLYKASTTPSNTQIIHLFRSLAGLCRAGVTLTQALRSIETPALKPLCQQLIFHLEQGDTLSQALEKSTLTKSIMTLALVRQGERNGNYPVAFDQIVTHLSWIEHVRAHLKKAITYPSILLVLAMGLFFFLTAQVVPPLLTLHQQTGLALTVSTRVLLFVCDHAPTVLSAGLGSVFLMIGASLSFYFYSRHSPFLLKRILRFLISIPFLGNALKAYGLLLYLKTLGVLLDGGRESILQAMTFAETALRPRFLTPLFQQARQDVSQGQPLSQSLDHALGLPMALLHILQVGEKGGTLPQALTYAASTLEQKLHDLMNQALKNVHPILILGIGGLLIFVVSAVFLPLYDNIPHMENAGYRP